MRIIVCVAQVTEAEVGLDVKQKHSRSIGSRLFYCINWSDRSALDVAVEMKQQIDDVEVVALFFGTRESSHHLNTCLNLGADRAVHLVSDSPPLSGYEVATVLSRYLQTVHYDMVLCGNRTTDWNGRQTGPVLAQQLDLPQITEVVKLSVNDAQKSVTAYRKLKRGARQIIECSLPAVIVVDALIREPRYISVYNQLGSNRVQIETVTLETCPESQAYNPTSLTECQKITPRRPRPKRTVLPEANLSASDRLKLMTGGLSPKKKSNLLKGNADEVVKEIVSFLEQENLLKEE